MTYRLILPALALGTLLAGCSSTVPVSPDAQLVKPTELEVSAAAMAGYRYQKGRDPVDLKIEVLRLDAPFITKKEYVACVSVAEQRTSAVYLRNGSVKHPIGSLIREVWAMLLRNDSGRWVAALLKQNVMGMSLGILKPSDICGDA